MPENWMTEMMFTPQPGNTIPLRPCGHLLMLGNEDDTCHACAAMPLVARIRAAYPHPRRDQEFMDPGAYCLGGACSLFHDGHAKGIAFPCDEAIADLLRRMNPHLPESVSLDAAWAIIAANDAGDFETGWEVLGKALTQEHA